MRHISNILAPAIVFSALAVAPAAWAEDVGCVSTNIRMLGIANDKICITSFKDPDVDGVVCHISRAETGGVKGAIGVAEDPSEASVSCRQTGPITIKDNLKDGEKVFRESRSFLFKTLQVVRFYDKPNNTLIYLTYSDKIVDGSPKNGISTVPIMDWYQKP